MIFRLTIMTGPQSGEQITVERAPMTIGSGKDCTICVADDEMATHHAVLEHTEQGLAIRDLGTMNRILVNHREVSESNLKHGDSFEVGRTRFLVQAAVRAEVEGASARPRPRGNKNLVLGTFAVLLVVAAVIVYCYLPDSVYVRLRLEAPEENLDTRIPEYIATSVAEDVEFQLSTQRVTSVTSVPAGTNPTQSPGDIEKMREDLNGIKQMMQTLVEKQTATGNVATQAKGNEPTVPQQPEKPDEFDVAQLMGEAKIAFAEDRVKTAEALLGKILSLDANHLPAYEQRALLLEGQGKFAAAAAQWQEVMRRTKDQEWSDRAKLESERLKKIQTPPPEPPPRVPQTAGTPVKEQPVAVKKPRVMKIANVEHTKFPKSDTYKEMRTLSIVLRQEAGGSTEEPVDVSVQFFSKSVDGKVGPARAMVSRSPLRITGQWKDGQQKALTATYKIPLKGTNGTEFLEGQYYGFVVKVSLGGVVQDQIARPDDLVSLIR